MNPNLARTLKFRADQTRTPVYANTLRARDNNDCTVASLQALTGIEYIDAYQALKSIGRRFWTGLSWDLVKTYLGLFEKFGFLLERVTKTEPTGSFLVLFENHAMACIDGVSVNGGSWAPVVAIYKVIDCR